MSDNISRQATLVAVKDALIAWSYMPEWRDEKILEAIAELPPSEPQRIRGRWIYSSYDDESGFDESWTCDKCGYTTNIEETNFCPNCGSYNRGETNDQ